MFQFGKKKEEMTEAACCCGSASAQGEPCYCDSDEPRDITSIKVLGAGCKSCHEQYENCKTAAAELGMSLEVEYITDMAKIVNYGVMSMPAIVVNEKVISAGKVLKSDDVVMLLKKLG